MSIVGIDPQNKSLVVNLRLLVTLLEFIGDLQEIPNTVGFEALEGAAVVKEAITALQLIAGTQSPPHSFEEYSRRAYALAIYPNKGANIVYPTLGLCGEAGEVAEKVKKILRDKGGRASVKELSEIEKELGDVLWYINAAAIEFGFTLEEIATTNLQKLESRQKRGTLSGSGDDR